MEANVPGPRVALNFPVYLGGESGDSHRSVAHVAELADAYGSGPYGATLGGSSPLVSTNFLFLVPIPAPTRP